MVRVYGLSDIDLVSGFLFVDNELQEAWRERTVYRIMSHGTRPQGEWEGVWWCSVEPREIGLTALEGAGDGINQHAKDRLAQLTAGLAQR
jgi:hypothetical protein